MGVFYKHNKKFERIIWGNALVAPYEWIYPLKKCGYPNSYSCPNMPIHVLNHWEGNEYQGSCLMIGKEFKKHNISFTKGRSCSQFLNTNGIPSFWKLWNLKNTPIDEDVDPKGHCKRFLTKH